MFEGDKEPFYAKYAGHEHERGGTQQMD
jgi:hypothetical protein